MKNIKRRTLRKKIFHKVGLVEIYLETKDGRDEGWGERKEENKKEFGKTKRK